MADKTTCTVCSKPASFFCLCTSLQTLLCPLCVATHIGTRGAHLISPLSAQQFVKKAEDLDRYNLRLQVVSDLTTTLDSLATRLETERKATGGVIAKMMEERIGAIRKAFGQTERDMDRLYDAVKGTIQAVRKELTEAVSVSVVQLSEEAQLFIKSASHIRERLMSFIDIPSEVNRRISLSIEDAKIEPASAFHQILEDKSCGSPNCFSCEEIRKALELITPQPPILPPSPQAEEPGFMAKLFGAKIRASAEEVMKKRTESTSSLPSYERS